MMQSFQTITLPINSYTTLLFRVQVWFSVCVCASLWPLIQDLHASFILHTNYFGGCFSFTRSWLAGFSYYLLTLVLSNSTHNHEVAAMYLPWTTVLSWPLVQSFQNESLRTVCHVIQLCTTEQTNEQTNERMNELHEWELNLDIEKWNPPLFTITLLLVRSHSAIDPFVCHVSSALEIRLLTWVVQKPSF